MDQRKEEIPGCEAIANNPRERFARLVVALCAGALLSSPGVDGTSTAAEAAQTNTAPTYGRTASRQTYRVHWLPNARIVLDGRADEPDWKRANTESHFVFPWKKAPAPATTFRALCDGANLYFTFHVEDADVFVLDKLRDEEDEVFEDRVEVYFSLDEQLKDYFCFEVDSRGRAFDYRATFYRRFDTKWTFPGLETRASSHRKGYEVEGRIPLKSFQTLGFPEIRPGTKIRCGLYRAEFSHDRSGKPVAQTASVHNLGRTIDGPPPIEEWMSWIDPKIMQADFHVPATLGWLEFARP